METYVAPDNLKIFFEKLLILKGDVKYMIDNDAEPTERLKEIHQRLETLIKNSQEIQK